VKLSLVHAAGLSDVETRSRGHLWALGDGGLLLGFGSSKGTGTSQTQLSKLAEPPRKKRYRHVILAWLIGLFMAGPLIDVFTASEKHPDTLLRHDFQTFAYIFSALVALVLVILWRFNHVIFPRRRDVWYRSFLCRRCGEIFVDYPSGKRNHDSRYDHLPD
jgi:hypothetical protein